MRACLHWQMRMMEWIALLADNMETCTVKFGTEQSVWIEREKYSQPSESSFTLYQLCFARQITMEVEAQHSIVEKVKPSMNRLKLSFMNCMSCQTTTEDFKFVFLVGKCKIHKNLRGKNNNIPKLNVSLKCWWQVIQGSGKLDPKTRKIMYKK